MGERESQLCRSVAGRTKRGRVLDLEGRPRPVHLCRAGRGSRASSHTRRPDAVLHLHKGTGHPRTHDPSRDPSRIPRRPAGQQYLPRGAGGARRAEQPGCAPEGRPRGRSTRRSGWKEPGPRPGSTGSAGTSSAGTPWRCSMHTAARARAVMPDGDGAVGTALPTTPPVRPPGAARAHSLPARHFLRVPGRRFPGPMGVGLPRSALIYTCDRGGEAVLLGFSFARGKRAV